MSHDVVDAFKEDTHEYVNEQNLVVPLLLSHWLTMGVVRFSTKQVSAKQGFVNIVLIARIIDAFFMGFLFV